MVLEDKIEELEQEKKMIDHQYFFQEQEIQRLEICIHRFKDQGIASDSDLLYQILRDKADEDNDSRDIHFDISGP